MLEERVYKELESIVGEENITADPAIMDTYAWQYAAEMLTKVNWMFRPEAVVLPASTEEVAEIVKLCNREKLQYKAVSTGFGAMGAASGPGMIQLDLRRMNRIVEIDEKNMYAVVEPYVSGTALQVETMKRGLNTHIVGAGGQTSVLASATSVMGQGLDGIYHGFSNRNLMGVEWVLPTGEIIRLGSPDASGKWFSGDGPGPSLRGVMRGFAGTLGGLGVFTKCAVKLFPWPGPERLETKGRSPEYWTEIPPHFGIYVCIFPDWDSWNEAGYKIGDAEIGMYLVRNAPVILAAIATETNNDMYKLWQAKSFREIKYNFGVLLGAHSEGDFKYQEDALLEILDETKGAIMLSNRVGPRLAKYQLRLLGQLVRKVGIRQFIKDLPIWTWYLRGQMKKGMDFAPSQNFLAFVKNDLNMRAIFRFGGSFWTSLGALESFDNSIKAAKVGARVKEDFIKRGVIFDDDADNAWGGFYEHGAFAHLEELAAYDPTDQTCRDHIMDFVTATNAASVDESIGLSINAVSDLAHVLYGPSTMNYPDYIRKIKNALDPNNASEGTFYSLPNFEELMQALLAMQDKKDEEKQGG